MKKKTKDRESKKTLVFTNDSWKRQQERVIRLKKKRKKKDKKDICMAKNKRRMTRFSKDKRESKNSRMLLYKLRMFLN